MTYKNLIVLSNLREDTKEIMRDLNRKNIYKRRITRRPRLKKHVNSKNYLIAA